MSEKKKLNNGNEDRNVQFKSIVTDCKNATEDVLGAVSSLQQFVFTECVHREGISALEVKNHEMVSYLTNLCHLAELMASGRSIVATGSVDRLIDSRTVLEKMKPLEEKLKHQLEKIAKFSLEATESRSDKAMKAKCPHPEQMDIEGSDDESDSSDKAMVSRKYEPPKLVPVHYDGDADKEALLAERAKRRAIDSSLVQELKQQYSQAPEEIRETESNLRRIANESERLNYEEEMMVRLQTKKSEKKAAKQRRVSSTLDALLDFGDYMAMDRDKSSAVDNKPKKRMLRTNKRRSKVKKSAQKKKSFGKKRRKFT